MESKCLMDFRRYQSSVVFRRQKRLKGEKFLNIFGVECLKKVSILSELIQYRTFYHCPELTKHSV